MFFNRGLFHSDKQWPGLGHSVVSYQWVTRTRGCCGLRSAWHACVNCSCCGKASWMGRGRGVSCGLTEIESQTQLSGIVTARFELKIDAMSQIENIKLEIVTKLVKSEGHKGRCLSATWCLSVHRPDGRSWGCLWFVCITQQKGWMENFSKTSELPNGLTATGLAYTDKKLTSLVRGVLQLFVWQCRTVKAILTFPLGLMPELQNYI